MRRGVIILLIVLGISFKATGQVVYNGINFKYTPFIYAICYTLNIKSTIRLTTTRVNVYGFTIRVNDDYVIFLNEKYAPFWGVIAHELVHVWQDLNGIYDVNKGTTRLPDGTIISSEAKQIEKQANKKGRRLRWHYLKIILAQP